MTILISANGDVRESNWIRPLAASATAVVAANGGSRHLWSIGVRPDLLVGDMDSLTPALRQWLAEGEVEHLRFATDKDETDLEIALQIAAERWDEPIEVVGAFGGRFDQVFANVSLLAHPAFLGRDVTFFRQHERLKLLAPGLHTFAGAPGDRLSLMPFGQDVVIERTTGLKWTLEHETLTFGPARGVSNAFAGARATVLVNTGILLAVHATGDWQR